MKTHTETPRILCGTDYSSNAQGAALVAASLAVAFNARLELVHVVETAFGHLQQDAVLEPARRKLRVEADRLRANGAEVDEILEVAPFADRRLAERMKENQPLLAVVSSVSKATFERWTLGSVSEHLAQNAPCPTLVVRDPAKLVAWLQKVYPLKIFAAVDFTETSDRVLQWLAKLQVAGPCEAIAGHVNWPPRDVKRLGEKGSVFLVQNTPRVQRSLLAELEKKVGAVRGLREVTLKVAPNWGRPDAALVTMATELSADLVIVGAHQRHGWARMARSSVSEGVLRHCPANVLCVPACVSPEGETPVPRYRRVLVATDFSPLGNAAVPHAYAGLLAGGEVRLIHVVPPARPPSPLVAHYDPQVMTKSKLQARTRDARAKLRDLIPAVATARGVTTDCMVVTHDNPAQAIVEMAERFGADLICLGSHGRSRVADLFLGSVAQAVLKESRRPVLVVRPFPA